MKTRRLIALLLILGGLLAPMPAPAATIEVQTGTLTLPGVNLGTTQVGNADTTNTMDRGNMRGSGLLKIVSTIGGGPTVTVNILGSMDNTNFFNVAYALQASPETVTSAAITITTATTGYYILRPYHPWRYLKLNYSANTNVTLTADAWASIN
jgi:hypothetical protein